MNEDTETVTVTLDRSRKWVPPGTNKADTYGPGRVEVPRAMAQGLGLIPVDGVAKSTPTEEAQPVQGGVTSELLELVEGLANRLEAVEERLAALPADLTEKATIAALGAIGGDDKGLGKTADKTPSKPADSAPKKDGK